MVQLLISHSAACVAFEPQTAPSALPPPLQPLLWVQVVTFRPALQPHAGLDRPLQSFHLSFSTRVLFRNIVLEVFLFQPDVLLSGVLLRATGGAVPGAVVV